ncbi:DUF5053 domain-containing protein [Parabacteroides sp. PF5-9]|uniref:DUF5053 domain-containing protein n=1 Tax=Parabacteroides sp. PF5-9 TaxID=1742404 RepID=UPI0024742707|nr:DUF5053 domain-containing protein [Parabacteroides sp. PF5-9]MDH6356870.1 hypothetical protein [Parabacteroides sp. PF5-9]
MRDKIDALKEKYVQAKTDKEFETIQEEIRLLCDKDANAVAVAALESVRDTNAELIRDKLNAVLPVISVSYLAKTYFKKSPQWFYQRLNGNIVNGKPAQFTKSELGVLRSALIDISNKINASASVVF